MLLQAKELKNFVIGLLVAITFVYLILGFDDIGLSIIMCIATYPLLLIYIFVVGKTIVMDEQGCEVRFVGYKKKYLWTEMEIKKIEGNWKQVGGRNRNKIWYDKGVYFSKRPIHKHQNRHLLSYALWHPYQLSFVFAYFSPKKETRGRMIYEVDEDLFMQKMKEWGVELEDCTRKDISK